MAIFCYNRTYLKYDNNIKNFNDCRLHKNITRHNTPDNPFITIVINYCLILIFLSLAMHFCQRHEVQDTFSMIAAGVCLIHIADHAINFFRYRRWRRIFTAVFSFKFAAIVWKVLFML